MDGTYTMLFVSKYKVSRYLIKYVTYGCIIVDYQPQKEDPHRTQLTVGVNLIFYSGDISTPTSDITTSKLIIKSAILKPGERYMCCDT